MQLNLFGFENKKKCSKCDEILSLKFFYKEKRYNSYTSQCKKCHSKQCMEWQIKNKEKRKKILKNYNLRNKNKIKKYRLKNEVKIKEYKKKWYLKNKTKVIERNKKYYNIKYKTDILFKLKKNIRRSIRQSFKNKGFYKKNKSSEILCIDFFSFKNYIENQFNDNMSWDNFDQIHIDHRIPLAAASTEFEVIALNHYTNLQPMWAEDNMRKSDKYDPEDFKKYMDWYRKNVKSDLV